MRKVLAGGLFLAMITTASCLVAADATKAVPTASASPKPKPKAKQTPKPGASPSKSPGLDLNAGTEGPITTEIFADEAFFDSSKSMGIFRGRVKVNDPRFNLQSDKLTVFISKTQKPQPSPDGSASPSSSASPSGQPGQTGQGQALEKAIAEGNVAVVRDRPDPNGGPPTHAVGRADTATYVAATGDVELKGSPRVQQGLNTHIATSPDTVMVINQSGELTTHGPSRTDIRQQPKAEKEGEGSGEKEAAGKGEKKPEGKGQKPASGKTDKSPQSSPKP
jgi:lipopolysaccharide export system protein LptA